MIPHAPMYPPNLSTWSYTVPIQLLSTQPRHITWCHKPQPASLSYYILQPPSHHTLIPFPRLPMSPSLLCTMFFPHPLWIASNYSWVPPNSLGPWQYPSSCFEVRWEHSPIVAVSQGIVYGTSPPLTSHPHSVQVPRSMSRMQSTV